jgi:hypothetical protein
MSASSRKQTLEDALKKPIAAKQTQSFPLTPILALNLALQTTWALLSPDKNNFREFCPHQTGNGK